MNKVVGTIRVLIVAAASIAGTVVFMIACGNSPGDAEAASGCAQYQIMQVDLEVQCGGQVPKNTACDLPAGWQPVATSKNADNSIFVTRCK
jgi:hypothetical protein